MPKINHLHFYIFLVFQYVIYTLVLFVYYLGCTCL
nr:MAG TPA: hypothetical protein [Caudoviricetes sp.]